MFDPYVETWVDDEEVCIKIQWSDDWKEAFLHHDLKVPITPQLVKRHREGLSQICTKLYMYGYDVVYAYSPCQSEKWKKLCKLFGFKQSVNRGGSVVFYKETKPCQ